MQSRLRVLMAEGRLLAHDVYECESIRASLGSFLLPSKYSSILECCRFRDVSVRACAYHGMGHLEIFITSDVQDTQLVHWLGALSTANN